MHMLGLPFCAKQCIDPRLAAIKEFTDQNRVRINRKLFIIHFIQKFADGAAGYLLFLPVASKRHDGDRSRCRVVLLQLLEAERQRLADAEINDQPQISPANRS